MKASKASTSQIQMLPGLLLSTRRPAALRTPRVPGRWLAVGDFTGAVALFDARDRFICRRVLRRGGAVPTVVFSPDSSTLAIGSWDNTVSLYDVETGELRRRRRESRSAVDAGKKD